MATAAVEHPSDMSLSMNGENPGGFAGKVVQITNVSPGTSLQQIATLFGFLGTVTDIRMYPTDETQQVAVKLCYIKYESPDQCLIAQHLTNTVFIDKALIIVPINREEIPEEGECAQLLKSINTYAGMPTTIVVPEITDVQENNGIPRLPAPPIITSSTDPIEIDEIRRTIFVTNIDDSITSEQLMAFFSGVGEIKYLRLVTKETRKYAFIEFTAVESVSTAMQYNGVIFGGKSLNVDYGKNPIIKPESEQIASGRTPVRRLRDNDVRNPLFDLRHSRSRSASRKRSPSRDRSKSRRSSRRSKSRSRSRSRRRRSRSRSRSRHSRRRSLSRSPRRKSKSRSRSPVRRRRRSRTKSRSPIRSPIRRRRSRSRSRSRERRRRRRSITKSPSRSPKRKSKKKSRSKSRSPSRRKSRRSISRSPDRSSSRKKKRDKDKDKERDKDKDKDKDKEKVKDKDKEKGSEETEKELQGLLTKIYDYDKGKEKEKREKRDSSAESSKKKKKSKDD